MKLFTHIWNFMSFQGSNEEKNKKDIAFLKTCFYYMSAFGLGRGLYLADSGQSFIVFNYQVDNVYTLSLMCIAFQLCLATVLAYFYRLHGLFNFQAIDETEQAPTVKDQRIIEELVAKVNEYDSEMAQTENKEERERLTIGHINQMRDLAKQLSNKKQTQFLHDSVTKKMQKLEKKLMNHKI